MTTYFSVKYDTEASGPFVAEDMANLLTWNAGSDKAMIVTLIDEGTTGILKCALLAGTVPVDAQVLTQGSTTANADGDGDEMLYPAYFRDDLTVPGTGICAWAGPALGATHSFFFDGQTGNVTAGDTLTFSPDGQTCEIITVESDAGVSGELSVRFISNIDEGLPADNDTFSNGASGDGAVNGAVHDRAYRGLHLHRLLSDLNDNPDIYGNDDLSRVDPVPSGKDTDTIINLLSNIVINDTIVQHMYDASISQNDGDDKFSGLNVQVTSPFADTQPVLIQDDAIITDYWKNAFMPHSIDGNIRIVRRVREDGVDIDGRRVRGALLENNYSFFFGGTTLGDATTALALFAAPDGNNVETVGTLAGAPYNSIVWTEGYQLLDHGNGNGDRPFGMSLDFGSASSSQTYERSKYVQRRGTSETLFGRNAQLVIGINLDIPYDTESANLAEDEIMYWGTSVVFSGQTTNMTVGEVVTFSPSGAKGRLLYQNDGGATGTMVFDMEPGIDPTAADTMAGATGDGDVDSVILNTSAGSSLLIALLDSGAAGTLYTQRLTGLLPIDGQVLYGGTSDNTVAVNGTVSERTINNQFVGVYTGTNFQSNHGISIDISDAVVGDKFPALDATIQEPPNNQQGKLTGAKAYDTVMIYPWNGSTYDTNGDPEPTFAETTLTTALVAASSTTAIVAAIPDNTPAAGFLRIERDSDNNLDLIEYSSYTGLTYTLVGTAPSAAAIGNTVMRALVDKEMTADGDATYTAIKGAGSTQVVTIIKNGYAAGKNGPIKPAFATATFGASGFAVPASRISDA